MFCIKCGAEIDENDIFCIKCGTKIVKKKRNHKVIVLIGIAVLFSVTFLGMTGGKDRKNDTNVKGEQLDLKRENHEVRWSTKSHIWEEGERIYYTYNGEVGLLSEDGEIIDKLIVQNDYRVLDDYKDNWMTSYDIFCSGDYIYWYEATNETIYRLHKDNRELEKIISFPKTNNTKTGNIESRYISMGTIDGELYVSVDTPELEDITYIVKEKKEITSEDRDMKCYVGELEKYQDYAINYADDKFLYTKGGPGRRYIHELPLMYNENHEYWEDVSSDGYIYCMDHEIQETDEKDKTFGTKYEVGYYDWEEDKKTPIYGFDNSYCFLELYEDKIYCEQLSGDVSYMLIFDLHGNLIESTELDMGTHNDWEVCRGNIFKFNREYEELFGTRYGVATIDFYQLDTGKLISNDTISEENVDKDNMNSQQVQKIDAARGRVTLKGRLEYRVGTNAAETMDKEMYVLHVEPIIGELIYYNYDTNDVEFVEDITEIDISGLYDEIEPGKYDGKMVTIEGEIWPTMNSHWFNSFAMTMQSIEFE